MRGVRHEHRSAVREEADLVLHASPPARLLADDQQDRALDRGGEALHRGGAHVVATHAGPRPVVELPLVAAVDALRGVTREVEGVLRREPRVVLPQPPRSRLQIGVAARVAPLEGAARFDDRAHDLRGERLRVAVARLQWALDRHERAEALREGAGREVADTSPVGVAEQEDRRAGKLGQRQQIDHVLADRVLAADLRLRVAVAAQVEREHAVGVLEALGDAVPAAAVVAATVVQQQRRVGGVAPLPVGQP